jgi:hypothetical protein
MSWENLTNVDDGIQALVERGFWFQGVRDENGEVTVLIGSYGWPDCYDRLHIWSEEEAIAARCVSSERHGADDVVWTYQDGALATIQALLELPSPDDPAAPKLAKRAPDDLWLPPSGARV